MSVAPGSDRQAATGPASPVRKWVTHVTVALGVGFAVSTAVIHLWTTSDGTSKDYVSRPEYGVWGGIVSLMITASTGLGVISLMIAQRLEPLVEIRSRTRRIVEMAIATVGMAGLLGVLYLQMPLGYDTYFPDHLVARLVTIAFLASWGIGATLRALWLMTIAATRLDPEAEQAINQFGVIASCRRSLLAILGVELTLAVLSTAAKHQANNTFHADGLVQIPQTYTLTVGLQFAVVLVATYVPAYIWTQSVARDLFAARFPTGQARSTAEAKELRSELDLDNSVTEHLQRHVLILAPLLAAVVSVLLPGVSF